MSEAQKEAREEAERRWPDWVCPPADEDPEPDYSEMDARWQNADSEMQRNAFVAGTAWQASRAPQPTEDDNYDSELAVMLSQMLDDEPMWSCVVIAKRLHAAGFRRSPAEPAVTDEQVEVAAIRWVTPETWGAFSEETRARVRAHVRECIEAALSTGGVSNE